MHHHEIYLYFIFSVETRGISYQIKAVWDTLGILFSAIAIFGVLLNLLPTVAANHQSCSR